MKKVALIGKIHPIGLDILKKYEFEIIDLTGFTREELKKNLSNIDAIALRTEILDEDIMKSCQSLKIVSRHGVGFDNVDIKYLKKKNIALGITGTSNAITVSEHVITMFLYLCKNINNADKIVKDRKYNEKKSLKESFEIYQKNILIIGFGRIGKELSKRCLAFETNVYVNDPYVDKDIIKKNNCIPIEFEEGLRIADFISLHMPLTNKTKNMIAKNEFELMKKNSIIVNTSRGGIINEIDLEYALKNNFIFGAGLDVYEKEPPEDSNPLFDLNNIVLTPHNAALTIECQKRMAIETCENIAFFLNDKKNLNNLNILNLNN